MKHNSNAVHAFLGKVLNLLKDSSSTLQKCIYFSDGAALQYKNYKNFDNICYHTMCQTFNLLLSEISLLRHMEKALVTAYEELSDVWWQIQVCSL